MTARSPHSLLTEIAAKLRDRMRKENIYMDLFCKEMVSRGLSRRAAVNFWEGRVQYGSGKGRSTPDIRMSTLQLILEATQAELKITCTDQKTIVEIVSFGARGTEWLTRWYEAKKKRHKKGHDEKPAHGD